MSKQWLQFHEDHLRLSIPVDLLIEISESEKGCCIKTTVEFYVADETYDEILDLLAE